MADIDAAATAWATLWLRHESGALQLCVTEDGDIGVYDTRDETEGAKALGYGDTVAETLEDAHTRWHATRPDVAGCRCVDLAENGESLAAYGAAGCGGAAPGRPDEH